MAVESQKQWLLDKFDVFCKDLAEQNKQDKQQDWLSYGAKELASAICNLHRARIAQEEKEWQEHMSRYEIGPYTGRR